MASWLSQPVELHGSRAFTCDGFTPEQCDYYKERWHFWYIADHVYALPTVAFFMCSIGIFIIGHVLSRVLGTNVDRGPSLLRRATAVIRYLSYRGFHVASLRWNSAPIGLLLLALVGVIFFFCMDLAPRPYYWSSLDFGGSPPLGTRSGWMALACMPFVFATATKANWITLLTGVSHEKLQVLHRWTAYAFFILALMHTFPFIVYHIRFHDMVMQFTMGNIFYWTGIVALIFQAWLTIASFGPLREVGYEFFKASHFFSVVVFVVIFFFHCDFTLTSWDYFIATAAVYVPCFIFSWIRTCFEHGCSQKARVFVEENDFTRIAIPATFDWVPGQHCFLRFRGFGLQALTSHPFTICSLPSDSADQPSSLTFYIRHRRGLTAHLHDRALEQPGVTTPVLVDGPYGGIDLHKYFGSDRLLVIAGGSGAGWTLPFIELFVRSRVSSAESNAKPQEESPSNAGRVCRRTNRPSSLRVILATRDSATRLWFHKTVRDLLSKHPSPDTNSDIDVQVYLTGEAQALANSQDIPKDVEKDASSPEEQNRTVKGNEALGPTSKIGDFGEEFHGRPPLPAMVGDMAATARKTGQSLGVFVCGPNTMQNDVRNVAAKANLEIAKKPTSGGVYLHLEHFSWA
ncbi:hypothetical protein, variant [Exophiala oligosperma]|uniref:ferric-chelate reductase (NADPH) n=1 Tax=Exophiala oligosperma TaxID=215243 RepID=A0A0D2D2H0_9EURO|nr:hypothetical protein, variant [Exophiala oligosperma]KIW36430.1 hypothetical protein, variant [Exophiala oligosperma]